MFHSSLWLGIHLLHQLAPGATELEPLDPVCQGRAPRLCLCTTNRAFAVWMFSLTCNLVSEFSASREGRLAASSLHVVLLQCGVISLFLRHMLETLSTFCPSWTFGTGHILYNSKWRGRDHKGCTDFLAWEMSFQGKLASSSLLQTVLGQRTPNQDRNLSREFWFKTQENSLYIFLEQPRKEYICDLKQLEICFLPKSCGFWKPYQTRSI